MTADEFRAIRLDLDLSQRELGAYLERSAGLIKKIEAGLARITPKIEQALSALAENPPAESWDNVAPRRGRPPGRANRPRAWQEEERQEADNNASERTRTLSLAVMALAVLVMLALAWLLWRDDGETSLAPA